MSLKTYDPKAVVVTFGGVPLGGFAEGTFLTVSRDDDSFTKVTGADGETSRAKRNSRSGSAVLTLHQTSPSNDVLSAALIADEATNAGVLPLLVTDLSGRSVLFSALAWVRKPADAVFGAEIENREWTLDCSDLDMNVAGNANFEPA